MKKLIALFIALALMLCACGTAPETPQSEGKPINKETTAPADKDTTKPTEDLPQSTPTTPDNTPDNTPENTPDNTPDNTPENTPETTPTETQPSNNTDKQPHIHNYSSKVTKEATCTSDGVKTFTCSGCSHQYTEVIDKLNHNYVSKVTQPTCTAQGYTTHTCSRCSNSYTDTYVSAKGHSFSSWIGIRPANPYETGENQRTCSTCGTTETQTVAKVQGYDGTVFFNSNNYAVQSGNENKISFNPRCVFWKDGKLVVQGYLINDKNQTVRIDEIDEILIGNGSVNIAYAENIRMDNCILGAKSYRLWQITFASSDTANYGASLNRIVIDANILPA